MKKVIIIAEIGPNHNGKKKLAIKLINEIKKCGADYVKFQISIPEDHISKYALKAEYQKKNTKNFKENQLKMSNKIALSFNDMDYIYSHCKKKKIKFLVSCFGLKSLSYIKKYKLDYYKIPSGEINNFPYLKSITKLDKKTKIILSTGMSTINEIKSAVSYLIRNGIKRKNINILHCNTAYPTPFEDANIKAILTIKNFFKVNVGYSDHTVGKDAAIGAVALGAKIIEKHVTLSKKFAGPDHKASLEINEFKSMVLSIRNLEKILGTGRKIPTKSEIKNIKIARNSIVANKYILKGQKLSLNNLSIKRPGSGISPINFYRVIGKKAKKNFKKDELIKI